MRSGREKSRELSELLGPALFGTGHRVGGGHRLEAGLSHGDASGFLLCTGGLGSGCQMGFWTVKAVGPTGMRVAEPVVHWEQALELESRGAALAVAGSADEASALQHLEVFGDGRLSQGGSVCDFDDAGLSGREPLEDGPTGGVGKGRESTAQGIGGTHNC